MVGVSDASSGMAGMSLVVPSWVPMVELGKSLEMILLRVVRCIMLKEEGWS